MIKNPVKQLFLQNAFINKSTNKLKYKLKYKQLLIKNTINKNTTDENF